jgi:hypothetical protein
MRRRSTCRCDQAACPESRRDRELLPFARFLDRLASFAGRIVFELKSAQRRASYRTMAAGSAGERPTYAAATPFQNGAVRESDANIDAGSVSREGAHMVLDRVKLCAVAAAVAASLTGEVFGQMLGQPPAISAPAPPGTPGLSAGPGIGKPGIGSPAPPGAPQLSPPGQPPPVEVARPRTDPTSVRQSTPAATQPSASRGLFTGADITGGASGAGGMTPDRTELPSSAFTKLDAASRGFVTLADVRQLAGFESAFRQADMNRDGRLNPSEFNSAWGAFTGNTR